MQAVSLLWNYRRILAATSWNDIRGRYQGTVLGLGWSVLYPIAFLGLYATVYLLIYRIRLPQYSPLEYVLMIFSGLIPFLGFSEALATGVGSVVASRGLIKNTMFPIELIPVKAVISSSVTMFVGLALLLVSLWLQGIMPATQAMIPLIVVLQLIFTIGIIWLLAALNVFFQDLAQLIGVFILLLMLISPIAYTLEMVPHSLMPLMYPNPLFYMIMLYRECIIVGRIPANLLSVFLVISVSTFYLGFYVFSRLKTVFSDYI